MKLPETIRAAFVIARRDYTSTVLSKTFLLFLIGPLFPLALGMGMVGIGAQVDRNAKEPPVAVISTVQDYQRLEAARDRLAPLAAPDPIVELRHGGDIGGQRRRA